MLELGDQPMDRLDRNTDRNFHQFPQEAVPCGQQNDSLMKNLLLFPDWFDLSMTLKKVQNLSMMICPP